MTPDRITQGGLHGSKQGIGQGDATGVFNRADYVTAGGEKLAQFAESVLWRATAPEHR